MVVNELKVAASGTNQIIHRKEKKVHTQRISETRDHKLNGKDQERKRCWNV